MVLLVLGANGAWRKRSVPRDRYLSRTRRETIRPTNGRDISMLHSFTPEARSGILTDRECVKLALIWFAYMCTCNSRCAARRPSSASDFQ